MSCVSIVVPVYNCERYLHACIRSILEQSYSNIEVILVDDGATDNSGAICDEYVSDSRVKVFHQENAGVSKTRNFGIGQATGEYIMFVDSDDTIDSDMVEVLVRALEEKDADAAFCGIVHEYEDYKRNFPETRVQCQTDGNGAVKEVLKNYIATAGPVCKLFRKTYVTESMFPEDLSIGEDAFAVIQVLQKMKCVVFDTLPLYHYNHREESLMTTSFSERDMDLPEAYRRIEEMSRTGGFQKEAEFRRIWAYFHVYDKMILSQRTGAIQEQEIVTWLKRNIGKILKNPYVGTKRKISACGLWVNRRIYQRIIRRK